MYMLASKLDSLPVMSLQSGDTVAVLTRLIIDPAKLELVAYLCQPPRSEQLLILLVRDVRQAAPDCLIVDSEDELTDPSEIIRIKTLVEAPFNPTGKLVVTDLGRRVGKVEDFTLNLETNQVQKLYVRQSLIQSFLKSSLTIDRAQIVDVTERQIVVRDTTTKATMLAPETTPDHLNP